MRASGYLISRALIHLLFWLLFIFISLYLFSDYYWSENPFLQFLIIVLVIVYVNNGILLPFFLKKKMYVPYFFIIGIIAFFATQLYCNYFTKCGCTIMVCMSNYLWQTLVPLIFFSFNWMLFRFLEKQKELEIIRKKNIEMELKFLKSQIDPHVLFNNLNTIYSFSLEKPEKVPSLLLSLSDNLKYMLYESNTQKVNISKEIEFIDSYIEFQKLRLEGLKKVSYSKRIDTSLQQDIAPLILISIIENAFKYSVTGSLIEINISIHDNKLRCYCKNEYVEKIPDELKKETIGLNNLRKRLSLLYPNAHTLEIKKIAKIFTAHLTIQLA